MESALQHCWDHTLIIKKIAINAFRGLPIHVDEEILLRCEPKFSDVFPRIVTQYLPSDFDNESKFITEFIGLSENPIAEMIIELARNYPEIPVEQSQWYQLNNEITAEVARYRQQIEDDIAKKGYRPDLRPFIDETESKQYITIVLNNPKRYQCPICKSTSGTSLIVTHNFGCPNKNKTPIEPCH